MSALTASVSSSARYVPDDGRLRLGGYRMRCHVCGAEWDAEPSRGGTFTGAGLDRQARAHWAVCPGEQR